MRSRLLTSILLCALLAGCATQQRRQMEQVVEEQVPADTPERRRQVHADLIRGMLAGGQYYAAIAHIQAQVQQAGSTPQLRLFEAEARRKLGQDEPARALYRELLKLRDHAADAYYGLGLISAKTDLKLAVWQLQQAVQRRPADAEMRNDLGYALMLARRYPEAMNELSTAVELDAARGEPRARNNLVLLMLVTGDETAVRRLVRETGMSDDTLAGLRRRAQALNSPLAPASNRRTPS
jgi:Flp pilus assembly protein TadD